MELILVVVISAGMAGNSQNGVSRSLSTTVVHVCVESITKLCKYTKNVFWGLACAYCF